MMTSNFSSEADRETTGATTRRRQKRKRLVIANLFYLKRLLTRRKFEANAVTAFPVQKRLRDRRHPAHPVVLEIGFVYANDAIAGFTAIGLANRHIRAETNDIHRAG